MLFIILFFTWLKHSSCQIVQTVYSEPMKRKPPTGTVTGMPLSRGNPIFLRRLLPEEYEVYVWLLQAYSIGWIAESLGLEKRIVKTLAKKVYKILEVSDQRELIRYYLSSDKYAAHVKPALSTEELAFSMSRYTDQSMRGDTFVESVCIPPLGETPPKSG